MSLPEEKIAKRALKAIEFICRQLSRFAKMTPVELMAYLRKNPKDAFCNIPHPKGNGHIHCGSLAWNKLNELVDLTIELDHGLGRRVGRKLAKEAVINAFVKRVLQEARGVDQETAMLLLKDALTILREKLVVIEHYLPCVLFPGDTPTEFSVGPVTFVRRSKFFDEKKSVLKHSIHVNTKAHIQCVKEAIAQGFPQERTHTKDESRQLVRKLQSRAVKAYKDYPWIACVKVSECDEAISKERAIQATEMALHIIRILLGAKPTREIRLAWSRSGALRSAHLHADVHGVIHASLCADSLEPVGVINWHEALIRANLELDILGSALIPIVNPVETTHLHQRLIDAINWFGDAVTDPNIHSSIVKYVSAIERLFFGKFEAGRTKLFGGRVRDVLKAFSCDEGDRVYSQALELYKTRSTLVHGEQFRTEDESFNIINLASELSRMCLLCSAQLYSMMLQAFENPNNAKLEEIMKRINDEGLNWLAEAAALGCAKHSPIR